MKKKSLKLLEHSFFILTIFFSATEKHIHMVFGDVKDVSQIEIDMKSYVKYYALVKLSSAEKARQAVEKFNNKVLMGNKVKVVQVLEQPSLDNLKSKLRKERDDSAKKRLADKRRAIQDLKRKLDVEKQAGKHLYRQVRESEQTLVKLRQNERSDEKERDRIRTEFRHLNDEIKKKSAERNLVSAKVRDIKHNLVREKTEVNRLRARASVLDDELKDLRRGVQDLTTMPSRRPNVPPVWN